MEMRAFGGGRRPGGGARGRAPRAGFLLLLVCSLPLARADDVPESLPCVLSLEPSNATQSDLVSIDALLEWCTNDHDCALAYHLDPSNEDNAAVFRHLIPRDLAAKTHYGPLAELVCTRDRESTLRALWLWMLLVHRRTQEPLCGIDHAFEFDPGTHEQRCVCLPDRPCTMATIDVGPLYAVYALVVIIAIAVLIIAIVRNRNLVWKLNRITGDERAGLVALFAAATG